ncbi:MAG: hypothetical protein JWN10_72 [Solirubrobacterales bacterium]|nr:hypothetical protein [Solirubrobacterales bacterium]
MRGVQVALGACLTLLAVAIGLTLSRSPATVAATNKPHGQQEKPISSTRRPTSYCQAGETLPRGTSAIRISLGASIGPRVSLLVSAGGRAITSGEQDSGWTGWVLAVPVRPFSHTVAGVTICASFAPTHETLVLFGKPTRTAVAAREGGRPTHGRMWIEYLRPGTRSWASLASSVVRDMGFGRAWSGSGIAFVVLALLAAVAILASRLVLTEMR